MLTLLTQETHPIEATPSLPSLWDTVQGPVLCAGGEAWNRNDRLNYNVLLESDMQKLTIIPGK